MHQTREDKIPSKLVKLVSKILVEPLTKVAAVTPLDKGGKNKMNIGNYRPVSILTLQGLGGGSNGGPTDYKMCINFLITCSFVLKFYDFS